jgi:hypothetical protein
LRKFFLKPFFFFSGAATKSESDRILYRITETDGFPRRSKFEIRKGKLIYEEKRFPRFDTSRFALRAGLERDARQ